ncbi:MAG: hypothetical protein ACKO6Q_04440 [Bacteroidota bacterium]
MTLGENSPAPAHLALEGLTQSLPAQDNPGSALEYLLLSWDQFVNELEFE